MSEGQTSLLAERIQAWATVALQRAVVTQVPESDVFMARIPGLRKCVGMGHTESEALATLEDDLVSWASCHVAAGKTLPTWEPVIGEPPPDMVGLVRISRLQHLLKCYAKEWGVERQLLPAGAVNALLIDLDVLVRRHAAKLLNPQ